MSDFVGLAAALRDYGYILDEPMELWRSETKASTLELICIFWDEEASRVCWEDPKIKKMFNVGGLLHDRLDSEPEIVGRQDEIREEDNDTVCGCVTPSALIVRTGTFIPDMGGLYCPFCNSYVPPYRFPMGLAVNDWRRLSGNVYEIWLASGVLEDWALKELSNFDSELNRSGRDLARTTSETLGIEVYFELFTEESSLPACPNCQREGSPLHPDLMWHVCKECGIAY